MMSSAATVEAAARRRVAWWQPAMTGTETLRLAEVIASNYLNEGEVVEEFEAVVASWVGAGHAVATTSGTAALFLALAALEIGPGDEVLVPDITFVATANAVALTGARAVLVDVDSETLCLAPEAMRRAITGRTRAVVPVHVSGRAATLDGVLAVAREHSLFVVEDAAEALGSRQGEQHLGTIGHVGCYSLSPNKAITTGQGGVVVTRDAELAGRVRTLKDQGRPVRGTGGDDVHATVGYNFKFTNLQAAVGLAQASDLRRRLQCRQQAQAEYARHLQEVAEVRLLPFQLASGEVPLWTDAIVERRDALVDYLAERDIHCRRFWFPLHTQRPYRQEDEAFPAAARLGPQAVWLPSALSLTPADIEHVCLAIKTFYQHEQ